MKTKELADWLGLATSTIRTWAGGDFRRYLSPTAQGGDSRTRNFTDRDARLIAFIAALKNQSTPMDEIHVALQRMQADDWRDLPPMPPTPPGTGPIPVVARETAETAISTQRSALMREITLLEDRVETLVHQLDQERQEKAELQSELTATREQLGELRGKLSTIEAERLPVGVMLRVAAVFIIGMLILLALAVVFLANRGG